MYLNGTVLSRGPSPSPLNGTLILEMRRADISGPFVELSSWYLNNSSWGSNPGEFSVDVLLEDHTGSSFASFEGEYTLLFDGVLEWNQTDPDAGRVTPTFTPTWNMAPGDYDWNLSYAGSTWLNANSTSGVLRVRGLANATANLTSDWSVRGLSLIHI